VLHRVLQSTKAAPAGLPAGLNSGQGAVLGKGEFSDMQVNKK
jgi:hypothetical protein